MLELARLADVVGLRHRQLPGPPVPAAVPGHVDAAVGRRGGRRPTCASRRTSRTCRCGAGRARPRARRAWTSSSGGRVELGLGAGDVLGRDRGQRRAAAHARASVDALAEASRSSGDLERGPARPRARAALHGRRREAGAAARARHRDLARRLQAADAAADRARRPTAGCRAWPTSSSSSCPRMNAAIDEAADATPDGAPEEIRRLLNINGSFGTGARLPRRHAGSGPSSSPSSRSRRA